MFNVDLNLQLGGELLKIHDPHLTVMRVDEHTADIFFNDFKKYQF